MIIFVEGLSKSGKTTLIDLFIEKYKYGIRFKGAGQVNVGIDKKWEEYNYYMHNIIERLDQLNKYEIPIFWDRGLSEAVYSDFKWVRLAKSHAHKMVIFMNLSDNNQLINRKSLEGNNIKKHFSLYTDILKAFDTHYIDFENNTNFYITDANLKELHIKIVSKLAKIRQKMK